MTEKHALLNVLGAYKATLVTEFVTEASDLQRNVLGNRECSTVEQREEFEKRLGTLLKQQLPRFYEFHLVEQKAKALIAGPPPEEKVNARQKDIEDRAIEAYQRFKKSLADRRADFMPRPEEFKD